MERIEWERRSNGDLEEVERERWRWDDSGRPEVNEHFFGGSPTPQRWERWTHPD